MLQYRNDHQIPQSDLLALYNDVGWAAYTSDPETLTRAVSSSLRTISAWEGDELVGLIRAVGDGLTILYIQDILVLEKHQRRGIGSVLLGDMLAQYEHVRQIVLLTDATAKTRAFYEKNGFGSLDSMGCLGFMYLHKKA